MKSCLHESAFYLHQEAINEVAAVKGILPCHTTLLYISILNQDHGLLLNVDYIQKSPHDLTTKIGETLFLFSDVA